MVGKYKVITLCGSTRFKDAFMEAQKRLTLQGNIVIGDDSRKAFGDVQHFDGIFRLPFLVQSVPLHLYVVYGEQGYSSPF